MHRCGLGTKSSVSSGAVGGVSVVPLWVAPLGRYAGWGDYGFQDCVDRPGYGVFQDQSVRLMVGLVSNMGLGEYPRIRSEYCCLYSIVPEHE